MCPTIFSMSTTSVEEGFQASFKKNLENKVFDTSSVQQLYAVFLRYKDHLLDDYVANMFLNRIEFFKNKAKYKDDSEQCEELILDIEAERSLYYKHDYKVRIDAPEINLTFKSRGGLVLKHAIEATVAMAIDRFQGNKQKIADFLGTSVKELETLVNANPEIKQHYEKIRKEVKKNELLIN